MRSPEAKSLPGSRWVGVAIAVAFALLGAFVVYLALKGFFLGPAAIFFVYGAVVFALAKVGSRHVWPSFRGHRLSALLLLVWPLAVLAAWVAQWNISTLLRDGSLYVPGLAEVWAVLWGWVLPQASVPFLAGIAAAWWKLTDPETTSRFRSGLAKGVVAGVVSMAALALGYGGVVGAYNTAEILALSRPVILYLDGLLAPVFIILSVPGGALLGLLGGLAGSLAAMVRRRAGGSTGIRRPA